MLRDFRNRIVRLAKAYLKSRGYELVKTNRWQYPSETSKCRHRLAKFCAGYGIDVGFGGDPIDANAIRIDSAQPYATVGQYGVQLGGDATNLYWFQDGVLDYVYSSHLLEDFEDTRFVLVEWMRVLKSGGRLVLYCPDEQIFREHCSRTGQPYNPHHKLENFSLVMVKDVLAKIGGVRVLHETPIVDVYSWELVIEKL